MNISKGSYLVLVDCAERYRDGKVNLPTAAQWLRDYATAISGIGGLSGVYESLDGPLLAVARPDGGVL